MANEKKIDFLIFIACIILLGIAYFMQYIMGLSPCYLCITQRFFIAIIGLFSLLAFIHNKGPKIYGLIVAFSALIGGYFASKQLWLQSLPPEKIPACGPPVDYLFDSFNVSEAIKILIQGDGNCAAVQWTFIGISIPGWSLICFIAIVILSVLKIIRNNKTC
jgi:disulfide bond formation protein DsbB